jgi:hypothetical protein
VGIGRAKPSERQFNLNFGPEVDDQSPAETINFENVLLPDILVDQMRFRQQRAVWSFFSGAMGLDLGLEEAGLRPTWRSNWTRTAVKRFVLTARI